VGGFMLGIMNMWIAHQAKEDIMHRNYKAAITVLRGIPLPAFSTLPAQIQPSFCLKLCIKKRWKN